MRGNPARGRFRALGEAAGARFAQDPSGLLEHTSAGAEVLERETH